MGAFGRAVAIRTGQIHADADKAVTKEARRAVREAARAEDFAAFSSRGNARPRMSDYAEPREMFLFIQVWSSRD
jgi:hypothetical protein